MYLRWQQAVKDLQALRDPMEAAFFKNMEEVDGKAIDLYKKDPEPGRKYLTDSTRSNMEPDYRIFAYSLALL